MIMKKNLHSADRVIRLLIFVVTAILYFTGSVSGTSGLVLLLVGVVLAATSFINFCPIYWMLGISTRPKDKSAA